jgi:hypothetical protein
MTLRVRPVCFDTDRKEFVELLQRNLPALPHAERFAWLYERNPDGPAWAWIVVNEANQKAVGATALFPHGFWLGSKKARCGQVGDFAIDIAYRSLGPALQLQRSTFKPVDDGELAFCYDCPPHDQGMSTFLRLGLSASSSIYRHAKVLKVDRLLENRMGRGICTTATAKVGNLGLQILNLRFGHVSGTEISLLPGPFDHEFDTLDSAIVDDRSVRASRSAAHLNWRFRQDPLHEYQVLVARRNGELLAYVVVALESSGATVVDLFGKELTQLGAVLLDAARDICQKASLETLHAFLSDSCRLDPLFKGAGFWKRELAARVVVHTSKQGWTQAFLAAKPEWSFQRLEVQT